MPCFLYEGFYSAAPNLWPAAAWLFSSVTSVALVNLHLHREDVMAVVAAAGFGGVVAPSFLIFVARLDLFDFDLRIFEKPQSVLPH